jgi:hypothetical protein
VELVAIRPCYADVARDSTCSGLAVHCIGDDDEEIIFDVDFSA